MKRSLLLASCMALLLLGTVSHSHAFVLEQSFDQSRFTSVGSVSVAESKRGLKSYTLERNDITGEQLAELNKAVRDDGFYTLRVTNEGASAQTSVRAACLSHPGAMEEFRVTLGPNERPVGLAYKLASDSCTKAAASALPKGWQRPAQFELQVSTPKQAPIVTLFGDDVTSKLANQQQAAQQAAQAQRAAGQPGGSKGADGKDGDKGQRPEDNRTWLQKNWLAVVGFGMVLLNTALKLAGPPEQGRPAGRR